MNLLIIIEDLALLIPTSGSTGGRRLVMLTKANLAANAKSIAESLRMDCTERSAVLMPVSYSYGFSGQFHDLCRRPSAYPETDIFHKECWDYLEEKQSNVISGVPCSYEWYRKLHVFDRTFEALRLMTTAGGAMSRSMKEYLLQEAERRNVDLMVMYGQTEAKARISSFFLMNIRIRSIVSVRSYPEETDNLTLQMRTDVEKLFMRERMFSGICTQSEPIVYYRAGIV